MSNLDDLLATANNAVSTDEFLTAAIPLIAYDHINKSVSYTNIESAVANALLASESEADEILLNTFLDKLNIVGDMSYNDTENMTPCDTSRVYKEWLARDQSLPKLSDYAKRVESYINNNQGA